ncbi:MAG: hypothetical protein WDW38_002928 [Sanguina aurantia]
MERALELLADDSKRVCMGNIFQPFMSLQDAAERLAPFHVLGAQDADEADLEELLESEGGVMLSSRADTSRENTLQLAVDSMRRVEGVMQRAEALQARIRTHINASASGDGSSTPDGMSGGSGGAGGGVTGVKRLRAEEGHLVERFALAEAQAKLEQERLKAGDPNAPVSDDEEPALPETGPAAGRGRGVTPPPSGIVRPAGAVQAAAAAAAPAVAASPVVVPAVTTMAAPSIIPGSSPAPATVHTIL